LEPAAAPVAALRNPLLPLVLDQTPGNGATLYYRAILNLKRPNHGENRRKVSDWLELPLREMPIAEVRDFLKAYEYPLKTADEAARRERCDWDLPIHSENLLTVLLEEVQEARNLAQLLSLQARLQMLDGEYPEAIRSLQTGFKLAQDIAEPPLAICGLVGIVISQQMADRVQELLQLPGAPNLYWGLTALPRPLIDLTPALQFEMALPLRMFPFLRDARTAQRTPEEWQMLFEGLTTRLAELTGNAHTMRPVGSGSRSDSEVWKRRLVLVAQAIKGYPEAKRHLLASGLTAEQVEQMPIPQVLAIYTADVSEEMRDEMLKWSYLPYWQARDQWEKAEQSFFRLHRKEIIPIGSTLLPPVRQVSETSARLDRQIAELRIFEALRMYAASHDGKFPATLDDITEVPVPTDPLTGEPFPYRLEGATARIEPELPRGLPVQRFGKHYELTVRGK
jgi:tetratricopeptide (TPR) repeat protein